MDKVGANKAARPVAEDFAKVLKNNGSLVIEIYDKDITYARVSAALFVLSPIITHRGSP